MAIQTEELIPRIHEKPLTKIWDEEKSNNVYTVQRTQDGFFFYEVKNSNGAVPGPLQERYTRMSLGVEAVKAWLEKQPKSRAKKRDENTAAREAQKAAKNDADHQGTTG